MQNAFPNFKTYYYRLNSSNNWTDYKNVTDYGNEIGGHPRIALSANKVHVVYNTGGDEYEENSYGSIISRDKDFANDIWETPILAFEATQYESARDQHILIDDNNVEWLFLLYYNLNPFGPGYQEWIAMVRQINGSWQELGELPPYSADSVQQLTFSLSKDMSNKIYVFYSIQSLNSLDLCRTIIDNGNLAEYSVSNDIYPLPLQLKCSSVSNDVYLIWRNNGSNYLSYQQYDASPLAPQNLNVTVSSSNHPLLSWTKNSEPDVNYYTIERSADGEYLWETIGQTSNSFYEDQTVSYCTAKWCDGTSIWYRVKAIDLYPNVSPPSDAVETIIDYNALPKISSNSKHQIPREYILGQNYPNPFNSVTKIFYGLPKEGLVTIKVYDVLGNEVATLANEVNPEGFYEVEFNANYLPSGVYIYKLQTAL